MIRRSFLTIASTVAAATIANSAGSDQPNIVLFFIDDLGFKDTGYSGSDFYETPNIDRLAKQGVVFTNAYATAGNCAPSRACLISGQYTPRHGVYAVVSTMRGPQDEMRLTPVPNNRQLAPTNFTIAEAMSEAGYATGMFGKWNLGGTSETNPAAQGFQTGGVINPPGAARLKEEDDPKSIYKITDAAQQFIEANKDGPFFAYIAHHAVHVPFQSRSAMQVKYADKKPGELHNDLAFAPMVEQVDDAVGIILKTLERLGLKDNTLVLFTSDNGGLPQSNQKPLRGFKGLYYEGGIRVPMIVRWPGVTNAGTVCDVPVTNVDFYPTFLDAAEALTPEGKTLDGESIVPLLEGQKKLKRDAIFWHFPGYLDRPNTGSRDQVFRTRPTTVIRKGDWKLHLFHEEWILDGGAERIDTNHAVELYNLAVDIGERNDLAQTNKAKRNELLADLVNWIKETAAPLPTVPGQKEIIGIAASPSLHTRSVEG